MRGWSRRGDLLVGDILQGIVGLLKELVRGGDGLHEGRQWVTTPCRASIDLRDTCGSCLMQEGLLYGANSNDLVMARSVDMPKLKSYAKAHNAWEVGNFLWGLEQYCGAVGITVDAIEVQTATLYVTDTVMLWWRQRQEDIKKRLCTINTFEDWSSSFTRHVMVGAQVAVLPDERWGWGAGSLRQLR